MRSNTLSRFIPALIVVITIALITPVIAASPFWLDNSVLVAIFSLLALSVGMAYGQAGILSIAPAAFGAIGAYATAIVTARYGMSPLLGLVLALLLPTLLAYPMARAITRLSPLPLSIATILLSIVLEMAIREGGDFTGGYIGISGIPTLWFADSLFSMHILSWALVAGVIILYANLTVSATGRAVKTAKHDPLRATADGINVPALLAVYFALSSSVAGLAGWLYAHHLTYMGPDSLTMHVSIRIVLMAVIGGASTMLGPVLGAAFLTLITLYLPAAETQGMIFGAVLILVLLVAPNGALGTNWAKLFSKGRGRTAAKTANGKNVTGGAT
ncbi:branched-chain amino acid ABC transporter permease [Pseudohoeflea coraliihabitans]|uniref:Branched-chain amino acid ABC transporter permease n=1 Tax=Pseudohoeflea coraliihabitans TaxID=2860393 RepID=A0ABS6WR85_9HYPH|nr:branched-chain amino acid ABC transporter permease [Pseudohoeflea sp. DP4N28-3]MBW3098440.1 branched-chain amino acid ABC transporter permease [Pseudohoeflea sp. DP4N28-3]